MKKNTEEKKDNGELTLAELEQVVGGYRYNILQSGRAMQFLNFRKLEFASVVDGCN